MKQRSVVIIGGGIGGLTLARFLVRDGHRVTVIERASDFSAQGHSIGFRGIGLQVLAELGLREKAQAQGRDYRATRAFTMQGRPLRVVTSETHANAVGGAAITQRGALHAVLHEGLPTQIDLRFGLTPEGLVQSQTSVTVKLSDGSALEADIVVGADGANSAIRRLALPEIEVLDRGGLYVAMTVKTEHRLPPNELRPYYGTARIVSFFPVDPGTVAVVLYQDDAYGPTPADYAVDAWATYLRASLEGAAEPVQRILGGLKAGDEIYYDRIRRIPPQRAVAGRVALVGDAGYCPTFFSGNGSALAALGGYCLAASLRRSDDDAVALADYEMRILGLAAGYQASAEAMRERIFTRSPLKIALRNVAMRYTPNWLVARGMKQHYRGEVRLADLA